jgi:hypothetical protein
VIVQRSGKRFSAVDKQSSFSSGASVVTKKGLRYNHLKLAGDITNAPAYFVNLQQRKKLSAVDKQSSFSSGASVATKKGLRYKSPKISRRYYKCSRLIL